MKEDAREQDRWKKRRPRAGRGPERRLRYLGLARLSPEERANRSCVMIQIDGLSHHNFRRAMKSRRLPFLSRLLAAGGARLLPWRSMLPTSTPAFQAGLFYGNNDDIPGFFWLDKATGQEVRMNGLGDTARTEARLRAAVAPYPGLLDGGSSYSALFNGGARYTFMTFSSLLSPRLNLSTTRRNILMFAVSQLMLVLRIAYYSTIEVGLALYDLLTSLFTSRNRFLEFKFLVPRIVSVVITREIATLAAILDIHRGVGPIYFNLLAYDEHAHHRGPRSRFAFWTLKGLDAAIARVARAAADAAAQGTRRFDLYVWSDHGQTECVPFQERMQQVPERHFDLMFRMFHAASEEQRRRAERLREIERLPRGRIVKGPRRGRTMSVQLTAARVDQVAGVFPGGLRRIVRAAAKPAREASPREAIKHPADPERRIRFISTGPVAHLYLMDDPAPLSYEYWRERYLPFLDAIAAHQAIGFTLARSVESAKPGGRAGQSGCMVGCGGAWFGIDDDEAMRRACPALVLDALRQRREEFRRWANMPSAGDLILFGLGAAGGERSISYSYEYGGHAGPSPEEMAPFILLPERGAARWPAEALDSERAILDLDDLHEALREAYQSRRSEPEVTPSAGSGGPSAA